LVGHVEAGGQAQFQQVAMLPTGRTVVGVGEYRGQGGDQFMIQNAES
jgi:hypothetical protein